MESISIVISWPYALGIIGTLIALAWYAGGRFSRIETSIEWLRMMMNEVKHDIEHSLAYPVKKSE